jgi:hypothetical protein
MAEMERFFVDAAGDPTDGGFLQAAIARGYVDPKDFDNLTPEELDNLRMIGPGTLLEMSKRVMMLPDIRAVRRLTGNYFTRKALAQANGDLRLIPGGFEKLQQEYWKPIVMMTGGYIFRNMLEAQGRMAVVGKAGFFNHPLRYIQYVLASDNRLARGARTITGQDIEDVVTRLVDDARSPELNDSTFSVMNETVRSDITDPVAVYRQTKRAGGWIEPTRQAEPQLWAEGMADELRQIAQDPVMNAMSKGVQTDEMVDYLRTDARGQKYLELLSKQLRRGFRYATESGKTIYVKYERIDDELLTEWVERLNRSRVNLKTAGDSDLLFATGYRHVPIAAAEQIDPSDINYVVSQGMKNGDGQVVRYFGLNDQGKMVEKSGIQVGVGAPNGKLTVREIIPYDVGDTEEGRIALLRLVRDRADAIDQMPNAMKLPGKVKMAQRLIDPEQQKLMNRATGWFFGQLYGGITKKFEKSPLFRQFYYENVVKEVGALSREEAQNLVDEVTRLSAAFKTSPERYVGDKKNWQALQNAAKNNADDGLGTMKELDEYARMRAIKGVEETLYNASSRNNLEDMFRIITPFGVAWREILSFWGKSLAEDPTRIRRAQLAYSGVQNFDPDQDGAGFFFKDPVTGQNSFLYPFTGELTQLITGVKSPLKGEVRRLSIGLSITPGLGPMAQIAASQIIPDSPKFDSLVKFLMPYGQKDPNLDSFLVPSYMTKVRSALFDDPNKMETIYGNTYMDTARALSATGDYGTDEQSKQRLLEDAKTPAKVLTLMRALAQFIGPVAPSTEFVIKNAKNQDMLASAVSQEFYRMQNENYDTAISEALKIFGDNAIMYMAAKTEAMVGGIEPTQAFVDWERSNEGFLDSYQLMGGYFAPGGDSFSFEAWDRMKRATQIRERTPSELWDRSQYVVASAIYRHYRDKVGAYPTDEQTAWLRNVRATINRRYPAFPAVPVFTVGEFDKKIVELKNAVKDERMDGNPVAGAISTYLNYRDQAIARYVQSGGQAQGFGTAKSAASLRQWLVSIGMAIGDQVPEFQRVWDRELMNEVDK